jgi:uncharacterized protein
MKKLTFFALSFSFIISIIVSCSEKKSSQNEILFRNSVIDSTNLLTSDQKNSLEGLIQEFESEVGSQIAIVIVDTLDGNNINELSLAIVEDLNLGRQKYRDGLLIFVSYKDREARIEVGYGLEKIIGDEIASRVMVKKMAPNFKKEKYYEGLLAAVNEIINLIKKNKQLIGKS